MEVIDNYACRFLVGSRREDDPASRALLLSEELDQLGIEWEQLGRQFCECADLLPERRPVRRQQPRQLANSSMDRDERQHAFDEGVRTNQRAVQIDTERLSKTRVDR